MDWTFVLSCLATLLAIVDPIGATAIFLAFFADRTAAERRRAARITALTVLVTAAASFACGQRLLALFGISIAALKVSGGLIIAAVGTMMLRGTVQRLQDGRALPHVAFRGAGESLPWSDGDQPPRPPDGADPPRDGRAVRGRRRRRPLPGPSRSAVSRFRGVTVSRRSRGAPAVAGARAAPAVVVVSSRLGVLLMFNIGLQELVLIFVIALLVFGPKSLPQLGRSLGRAMREFRRASDEFRSTTETNLQINEPDPLPSYPSSSSPDAAPAETATPVATEALPDSVLDPPPRRAAPPPRESLRLASHTSPSAVGGCSTAGSVGGPRAFARPIGCTSSAWPTPGTRALPHAPPASPPEFFSA